MPSAAGVIVYDGQGEALTSRIEAAQAVLLASDNLSTLQNDTTLMPSAGSWKPSPPQQVIDTPVPEPMAVSSSSDDYDVQFKDQVRQVPSKKRLPLDPDAEDGLISESGRFSC